MTIEYLYGLSIDMMLAAIMGIIGLVLVSLVFVCLADSGKNNYSRNSTLAKWTIIGIFAFVIVLMLKSFLT